MACDPTRLLRHEHQLILRVVGALDRYVTLPPADRDVDRADRFVEFFRLYTDALHHGKEEDLLFEALVEEGFPRHEGPIAQMKLEHELGRALVRQMRDAVHQLDDDSATAWRAFDHAAGAYIELLRRHIGKEDGGLFGMADDAIDEATCERLCGAYDRVCGGRFEGRTAQELERLGAGLVEDHGPRPS